VDPNGTNKTGISSPQSPALAQAGDAGGVSAALCFTTQDETSLPVPVICTGIFVLEKGCGPGSPFRENEREAEGFDLSTTRAMFQGEVAVTSRSLL
jgi:hypothetical protein